jgi:hypothetical protein
MCAATGINMDKQQQRQEQKNPGNTARHSQAGRVTMLLPPPKTQTREMQGTNKSLPQPGPQQAISAARRRAPASETQRQACHRGLVLHNQHTKQARRVAAAELVWAQHLARQAAKKAAWMDMDPKPCAILTPTSTQCIYIVCMRTAGACTTVHWARKQPKLQAFGVKFVLTHDEGTAQLRAAELP